MPARAPGKTKDQASEFYCQEHLDLLKALEEAAREALQIHGKQMQALIEGDADPANFEPLVRSANEKYETAKSAYLSHIYRHHCNVP
jgi:hypothetical protein